MAMKRCVIPVEGMQCAGCEDIIDHAVGELAGIEKIVASYSRQTVEAVYDDALIGQADIEQAIVGKGYEIKRVTAGRITIRHLGVFLLLLFAVGGVVWWGKSQMPAVMQQMKPHMDHVLLLGIGFLTGFHCIGMCGGFVVGYTDARQSKARQLMAHFRYGFGKTLSYATLGAGFGLLGAMIAITPQIRGGLALGAGIFLLLYGLRMLNVFSFLRRFILRLPAALNREIAGDIRKRRSALLTGLLSGLLLGCGPLQAMYVMAAGSGDPLRGAMILSLFGVGTLLPLWGFGLFATMLPANAMRQLVRVSGILVIVMGAMMAQRGMMMLKGGTMPAMPDHSVH